MAGYQGGKDRTGTHIAPIVLREAGDRRLYEPFCGGLGMTRRLQPRVAADASLPMITLINAVRNGFRPPVNITAAEYARVAALPRDETDPYICFVGQCCTFGGKWFGGFARRYDGGEAIRNGQRLLLKNVAACATVEFRHESYDDVEYGAGDAIYCDPPYRGTTASWPTPPFDHDKFWAWCDRQATRGAVVIVSEYQAPIGVEEVWSKPVKSMLHREGGGLGVTERLYRVG